jgi:hypothetical protein
VQCRQLFNDFLCLVERAGIVYSKDDQGGRHSGILAKQLIQLKKS